MARAITCQLGISTVSTDSLGVVLETVLKPEAEPGLFAVSSFNQLAEADRIKLMIEEPTKRIDYQRQESTVVWRAVEPFILREQDEGRDLVVEGVAVLPELVALLEGVDHRVLFVGNQGPKLGENIKKSARENKHDWMRHASDEYIAAFATFVATMSRSIEKEARRYRFEYIEMDGQPFNCTVAKVVNMLLGCDNGRAGGPQHNTKQQLDSILRELCCSASEGNPQSTPALLEKAWDLAQSIGDDKTLADTAHRIASRYRDDLHDNEKAEVFARRAVTLEERLGRVSLLGNHLMFLADLLTRCNRPSEALVFARRGLECYRKSLGDDHSEVAYMHSVVRNLKRQCRDAE